MKNCEGNEPTKLEIASAKFLTEQLRQHIEKLISVAGPENAKKHLKMMANTGELSRSVLDCLDCDEINTCEMGITITETDKLLGIDRSEQHNDPIMSALKGLAENTKCKDCPDKDDCLQQAERASLEKQLFGKEIGTKLNNFDNINISDKLSIETLTSDPNYIPECGHLPKDLKQFGFMIMEGNKDFIKDNLKAQLPHRAFVILKNTKMVPTIPLEDVPEPIVNKINEVLMKEFDGRAVFISGEGYSIGMEDIKTDEPITLDLLFSKIEPTDKKIILTCETKDGVQASWECRFDRFESSVKFYDITFKEEGGNKYV